MDEFVGGKDISRVFVLGAGASVHVGYPLTKDLGQKLMDWAEANVSRDSWWSPWPGRDQFENLGPLDDIEELVTQIEQTKKPGTLLAGLHEALCRFFDFFRVNEASFYQRFATSIVRTGDVIVSFNYDVSLDRELRRAQKWQIGDGYGFDLAVDLPTSPIKLLKLHGSTNWLDSLFGGARGDSLIVSQSGSGVYGSRPIIRADEFNFLEYAGITDTKYMGGGVNREGSMVLPGSNKQFCVKTSTGREREDFWNSLWHQAAEALQAAEEVTIIGYSLPEADERAQKLLFDNVRHSKSLLTICCGNDSSKIGDRFAEAGISEDRILLDWDKFENWIDAKAVACEIV